MSRDSEDRHASFAKALDLPFPLLSDPQSEIAKAYGITRAGGWLPPRRATFVIDSAGTVQRAISAELDMSHHARTALSCLEELGDAAP